MHLYPTCHIPVWHMIMWSNYAGNSALHEVVKSALKQVVHHHSGYLMLPQSVFNQIRQAVDVVESLKQRIRVDRHNVTLRHKSTLNFTTYPVVLVLAAVEGMRRQDEQEYLGILDCRFDSAVENAVFQIVEIKKNLVALSLKCKLHLACEICPSDATVTDENVVLLCHLGLVFSICFANLMRFPISIKSSTHFLTSPTQQFLPKCNSKCNFALWDSVT